MDGRSSGDDGPIRARRTASTDSESTAPPAALEAAVVEYETRPDRRTIYPADGADDRRLTAWLTANASAFVDLDDRR
ncbi:hypothetical protein CV102_08745 [Natronococcus pandeyae]|uniref:DUF7511 domain-containing protein n=1 Tax=Natronococcus pandeyae TaxID=2055836 RepID=A0A8J8Q5I9_9EURY|nr:hypothetical protein [Natronococcus pandeyae]TYL39349.1 hypothetical protein CV102_08745 [Natronococcus pandeyae]